MDCLTFISKLVHSLAWPTVVLAIIFIVKDKLPEIVRSLGKVSIKGLEFEFRESTIAIAMQAKAAVPKEISEAPILKDTNLVTEVRLEEIAELSPRAAILESWLLVEAAAADLIQSKDISDIGKMSGPLKILQTLVRAELLDTRQVAVFQELRRLRNEVVHVPDAEITVAIAKTYIQPALSMAALLKSLTK